MIPGSYDLEVYRGDTNRWQFKFWEDAGKTIPTDLTGSVLKSQIRDAGNGWKPITDMACTVTLPNIVNMTLAAAATLPTKGSRPMWDLQITWSNGEIQTALKGVVYLQGDVTESALWT